MALKNARPRRNNVLSLFVPLALWLTIATQMLVSEAAPPFSVSASTKATPKTPVTLDWSDVTPGAGYTVETRESLSASAKWRPAPATVWPSLATTWTDPRLPTVDLEFYRVVRSEGAATRGKLDAVTPLPSLTTAQIQALFAQLGLSILQVGSGVQLYKLSYETVNPFELRTSASGLLVLPENSTNALPLVSYQHGTIVARDEVPSAFQGLERVIGVALATTGYAAVLPDYVGLGDSPGLHPFVHAKSEAAAVIDLLRAARVFCASNGVALNGQLFLIGYSQGGHATMAAHREIETRYADEFTVTASAPMAGPYDLSGVTASDFLSNRPMPNPYYFLYLVAAYQSIYHFAGSFAALLISPYDALLPPLLDGEHDGGDLNHALGTSTPLSVLKPEFLDAFKNNPEHPLRVALRDNDVYNWTPRAPMHIYHCDGDQDVQYANSQVAYDYFQSHGATQVQLIDPLSASHTDCAPIALFLAKALWFDTLVAK